jgi:hypothetical protein
MEDVNGSGTVDSSQGKSVMLSERSTAIKNSIFLRNRRLCLPILVLTVSANERMPNRNFRTAALSPIKMAMPRAGSDIMRISVHGNILAFHNQCRGLPWRASHFGAEVALDDSTGVEVPFAN